MTRKIKKTVYLLDCGHIHIMNEAKSRKTMNCGQCDTLLEELEKKPKKSDKVWKTWRANK